MNIKIILVRPRNPQNIGAAARAMGNFGLEDLRVVAPYAPVWREAAAAVDAHEILKKAKVFPDILSAAADCGLIIATTDMQKRKIRQKIVSLPDIQKFLAPYDNQNAAIVFGPEKTGLSAEEIDLAHAVLNIPTTAKVPSINLAQSVILCCYELSKNTIKKTAEPAHTLPTTQEKMIVLQSARKLLAALDLPPTLSKSVTDKKFNSLNSEQSLSKESLFFINTIINRILEKLKSGSKPA